MDSQNSLFFLNIQVWNMDNVQDNWKIIVLHVFFSFYNDFIIIS